VSAMWFIPLHAAPRGVVTRLVDTDVTDMTLPNSRCGHRLTVDLDVIAKIRYVVWSRKLVPFIVTIRVSGEWLGSSSFGLRHIPK
jgi:hypothetical protein